MAGVAVVSHYDAAVDTLRCAPVSNDAFAVGMAILAVADRVESLTAAVEALTAAYLAQPARPAVVCPGCSTARDQSRCPVVCPGCSTVHCDSGLLCDTCAAARPA